MEGIAKAVAPSRPLTELFGTPELSWRAVLAIVFASVALLGTWGAVQKIPTWVSIGEVKGGDGQCAAVYADPLGHRGDLRLPDRPVHRGEAESPHGVFPALPRVVRLLRSAVLRLHVLRPGIAGHGA